MKEFRIEFSKKDKPLLQIDVKAKDYQTLANMVIGHYTFKHHGTYHLIISDKDTDDIKTDIIF